MYMYIYNNYYHTFTYLNIKLHMHVCSFCIDLQGALENANPGIQQPIPAKESTLGMCIHYSYVAILLPDHGKTGLGVERLTKRIKKSEKSKNSNRLLVYENK